jgi:DNA adenine methylase
LQKVEGLPEIVARLRMVAIENDDFRKIIPRYDTQDTFFYLDPPYVPETRESGGYQHEMSYEDHVDLVNLLLKLRGKAMLSGYANPLYRRLEQRGWVRRDFSREVQSTSKHKHLKRVESVWMSNGNCDGHITMPEVEDFD